MACGVWLAAWWHDFRFADQQQEQGFQTRATRSIAQMSFWWCLLSGCFLAGGCFLIAFGFPNKLHWVAVLCNFAPVLFILLSAGCVRYIPVCQRHAILSVAVSCFVIVAWSGWALHQVVELYTADARTRLGEVFTLVEGHPSVEANLLSYVQQVSSSKSIWPFLVFTHFYLDILRFFPYSKLFFAVYFSLPVMLELTGVLSPAVVLNTHSPVIGSAVAALYASATSVYITILKRREFQADFDRQLSLANEAKAMQEMARQEAAHKESAQQADSILNHSLKNMMADAAGCIHLYLQSLSGPPPADLAQAMACLDRGMGWCRKRQALLRVAAGQYVPLLQQVNLREMGEALVRGREVACSFADVDVLLDPLLTELVLDNSLNNAFRHGHPDTPDVHFSIAIDTTVTVDDVPTILFEVRNRSHPERPRVTPDLVDQVLNGEGSCEGGSALSEHLGLQHMFMAARACGMALTLEQADDVVTLRGRVIAETARASPSFIRRVEHRTTLPPGTRIFCVDDSAVARRLLHHAFSNHPAHPAVTVFGATAGEVEDFLARAVQWADIVVLDHYLDYGPVHYLGTELLQQLVQNGYPGLLCIRSANVSSENQAEYTELGAHCAVGKDISPKELLDTVSRAYFKLRSRCGDPGQELPPSRLGLRSLLSCQSQDSFCVTFDPADSTSNSPLPPQQDCRAPLPPTSRLPYVALS
eukprot:EG_transcript_1830